MLTIRTTVFFIAFAFCVSNASAQFIQSSVTAHPRAGQNPSHTLGELSLPFSVVELDSNQVQLNSTTEFVFECTVFNFSLNPETVYFKRSQLLPLGWSTSVCWGTTCYSSTVDSVGFTIPSHSSASLSLNVLPSLNNVPDSTTVFLRVGLTGSPADTVLLPFSISFVPQNPALVFQWSGISGAGPSFDTSFVGTGEHSVANLLENGFALGANYDFTIQDSLPPGWSLTTCIQSDYGDSCTTGNDLTANFSDYGDSTFQQAIKFTVNVPELTATDSAIIYLGVHPKISSPADSATYRFSMVVNDLSSVASQPNTSAGISIMNTWPNPLHSSSLLHIGVQTAQAGPVTAWIYDIDGTLQGTLEFAPLNVGLNDLQATMPDVPSGDYLIRIQQPNESPAIARINYIK